jgi:hypothetical protein
VNSFTPSVGVSHNEGSFPKSHPGVLDGKGSTRDMTVHDDGNPDTIVGKIQSPEDSPAV